MVSGEIVAETGEKLPLPLRPPGASSGAAQIEGIRNVHYRTMIVCLVAFEITIGVLAISTIPVRPWERIALSTRLVLTGGLLMFLAWRTGVTNDEPGHLVGANLYWGGSDRVPPGDTRREWEV